MFTGHRQLRKQNRKQNPMRKLRKWVKFTFSGTETLCITKFFKKCSLGTAYKTNNTNYRIPKTNQQWPIQDRYEHSAIYQLTCSDCGIKTPRREIG